MELVISALERQIKLEEAKLEKRERMLATSNQVVHSEPLQEANPEYIEQLKKAVHLLIWDMMQMKRNGDVLHLFANGNNMG